MIRKHEERDLEDIIEALLKIINEREENDTQRTDG